MFERDWLTMAHSAGLRQAGTAVQAGALLQLTPVSITAPCQLAEITAS
jgi:hypothetical protein